ncbi:MAG: hypothetical protein IKT97_03630 [Spirochaetia bacterium]|nr:hypothetical protein [Spirochaetia bacterium]
MELVFLLIGFLLVDFLAFLENASAEDSIPAPVTTYSREEGYKTQGQISLTATKDKTDAILWNFADYENWLLDGLTRNDPEAKKLTCTLNSMKYIPDKNQFKVYFSLNIWLLNNREYSISFTVNPMENVKDGIKLDVVESGKIAKLIETLTYTISIEYQGNSAIINYTGHCKLKGLAARFFSLRLYKKNFEWYVRTFAKNLMNRLES